MTKEQIQTIITLLQRVDIKGSEVFAYVQLINALQLELNKIEDKSKKEEKKSDEDKKNDKK